MNENKNPVIQYVIVLKRRELFALAGFGVRVFSFRGTFIGAYQFALRKKSEINNEVSQGDYNWFIHQIVAL